ncbi:MAG: fructosamine kinase family protein [Anaerolineae bacterium]
MIPPSLDKQIRRAAHAPVTQVQPVAGGDINRAARVTLSTGQTLFVKWHPNPPPGMFPAEARGLQLLASAHALRVPAVHFFDETCLGMEWLGRGSRDAAGTAAALGRGLAQQHRLTAERYGLEGDNYCGLTPQVNTPAGNWPAFFARNRLGCQMELAARRNRLPAPRRQRLERLIARLPTLLPARPPASLLHGDLWGGNWLVTAAGEPALIDPAVYFGHREADLAFTELFGGFPPAFYHAYRQAWPLESGYPERRDIYNLYHLLNHLNLFGEHYGRSVDAVLKRYT